ncbi:MAG: polysaccharide pyruvyl transferase family protein [Lachnospiraceae bacterium]|nr:polysaccharide pyruvyl transferase family protein [Lachnospiraceae bacterium]
MIGILTFVGTQSQGACLQAYALKKKIEGLGYETELINYECPAIRTQWTDKKPSSAKSLKRFVGSCIRYPVILRRHSKFRNFETSYLNIHNYAFGIDYGKYEKIIVGSDQVWNLAITGNDFTYFLNELDDNTKKYSYAASLGVETFPIEYENECLDYIEKFSVVNVREKQLKKYLSNKVINKSINVVLDPTLLLSAEEWGKFIYKESPYKHKYMLVHYPVDTTESWNKIRSIAREKGMEIVFITNRVKSSKECHSRYAVSPIEYINYIKYADMVITGSFHTLCFSLVFNKDVYCTDSMIVERNSRLANLLDLTGCQNRKLAMYPADPINFQDVNDRIHTEKTYSTEILKEICSH